MTVYTLFGQVSPGLTATSDTSTYTMGMQFTLSQSATLTGIWFYSGATATNLPVGCAIYQMTGAGAGSIVSGSQDLAPVWSGAAASGWVKDTYASGPVLAASTVYKVVILKDANALVYSHTSNYWDTGAGSAGLTSGIITAPNNAGGDGGQDTFNVGGSLAYPATAFQATNYWVDVEVTAAGGASVSGALSTAAEAAPAGTVTAGATVAGAVSTSAAAAAAGSVHAGAVIAGAAATAAAAAPAGAAGAGVAVTGAVSAASAGAFAGTVTAGISVAGLTAAATAQAFAGLIHAGAVVAGARAASTATAPAGAVPGAGGGGLLMAASIV